MQIEIILDRMHSESLVKDLYMTICNTTNVTRFSDALRVHFAKSYQTMINDTKDYFSTYFPQCPIDNGYPNVREIDSWKFIAESAKLSKYMIDNKKFSISPKCYPTNAPELIESLGQNNQIYERYDEIFK